jgi:chemotaxis family two-component system response regulator Rcp1
MRNELDYGRPAEVLLAEDNDNDVELTRQGFRRARLLVNLRWVKNGEECLAYLRKQGEYVDAPTPDLILLDLNMPKVGGREVLAEMTADEHLKCLPVVILTTSEQQQEILDLYGLRCSSYIVKPVDFDQFLKVVQAIGEYWFTIVVLPAQPQPNNQPTHEPEKPGSAAR